MKTSLKNRLINCISLLGNTLQYSAAASLLALSSAHATVIDWKSNAGTVTWADGTNWVGDVAPVADLTTDIARFNQTLYLAQPSASIDGIGQINGIQIGDGTTVTAALILSTGTGKGLLNLGNSGIVMNANSGTFALGSTASQGATILADQAWVNNSARLFTVNALAVDNDSSANPVLTLSGSGAGGYTFGKIEASAVTAPQVAGVLSLRFNRTGAGPITLTHPNTLLKGVQIGDGSTATAATTLTTGTGNGRPVVGGDGIVMNANSGAFNFGAAAASQGVTIVVSQTWQNNSDSLLTVNSFAVDNASSANPVLTLSGSGTGGYSLGKIENSSVTAPQVPGILSLVVNKSGAGVVDLTGNSTFTGGTTLTAGTLLLTHDSALGTGTFTINGGKITSSASGRITANPQVWGGDWTFGGANNWATGVSTVNLTGNRTVTVSGVGIPNVNSVISGSGDIIKAGSGNLTLSNSNSYVGKTIVNEGTLELDFGNNSVSTLSGQQSNKIPTTSPLELGGGTLTVTGGFSRTAWSVVSATPWASAALISSTATTSRYDLTFATLPAVNVGQPVTSILAGFTGFVQGISAATLTVTIDVPLATPPLPATGTDFAATAITSSWSAMSTTGLPSGQYRLTFASSIAVTPGQPVTATGLTGAYVVRIDGKTIIVASSSPPTATGGDFAVGAFAPNSSQTLASTSLVTSASTITAALNSGNGVKVDLGAITRAVGSTVQLNLPSGTLSTTNGIFTSTGNTSTALLDSGVAYATAGANLWAAKDATNTYIENASTDSNNATILGAPNSSTVTGIDTVLAANSSPVTMRSNLDEARTITARGFTITTGGVLVGSAVTAANGLTITGGILKSAATAADKDLVVINNGAGSLTINSTIVNSTAGATGLTKSGTGTVSLGSSNRYTGSTVINKGTLRLTTNTSLANSSGIVIGKDPTAILNLNFTGTEYVAALTINGVAQPEGVYSSSDPSGRIIGSGTLTVTTSPVNEVIAATVTFDSASLAQNYNPNSSSATASTDPEGLTLSYSYNDGTGATAAPVNAGSYEVIATVTSEGYSGTATGTMVIGKADPEVSAWPTAAAITYGDSLTSATLTGGLVNAQGAFSYDAPNTAPNAGTASQGVTFTPTDAANYNTATSTVSVTVNKATPSVTWPISASEITYGAELSTSVLSGGSGTGSFAFTSPSTTPNAGTASQGVTFTPTDAVNYNTATSTVSVTINKATPTVNTAPSASAITSGQSLSSSSLTGGSASVGGTFAFTAPSTVPTATGSQAVTFTPTDSANYNTASTTAIVTVNTAGFSSWATTNNLSGADALSSADPDNDGLKNGVEYVLGGNPKVGDAATIAPVGAKSGSNYTFTFKRTDASESDATVKVEYGNNLSGWTPYSIGATTESPVVVTENDTAADTVVVTIPNASATKFFARLKVVVP